MLTITKINEVYMKISTSNSIAMELSDFFTFQVPGYQFTPAYKNKCWDGKIRLYNPLTQLLYVGLLKYVEEFASVRNYSIEYKSDFSDESLSNIEALNFVKSLNLTLTPRPYQMDSFVKCVRARRTLLLSPTSSGKSLIIYLLYRYYNRKTLLIVPNIGLIHQMKSDFKSYGYEEDIHCIFSGQEKMTRETLTISTWQSIHNLPKEWFSQYDVVIGDEAHGFKSKSLISIMTKLENCKYRFGTTGTLDGTQTNKLVLEGLFGPVKRIINTTELIEQKHAAQFQIKNIVLTYPEEFRKIISKCTYPEEVDHLISLKKRNKFIVNLALSLTGNTLILYRYVEKHGKVLYNDLLEANSDKKIHFISGEVDGEERDKIRNMVNNNNNDNSILLGSEGTVSTGTNIPNLHNIIFVSPSKGRIKVLQAIGRVLRLADNKDVATLYDISDDCSYKTRKNFALLHFMERIKIYNEEKFPYRNYKVALEF